eukprot:COSAG04_NODE_272_length_18495_cov_17.526256_9_plen_330_part_00
MLEPAASRRGVSAAPATGRMAVLSAGIEGIDTAATDDAFSLRHWWPAMGDDPRHGTGGAAICKHRHSREGALSNGHPSTHVPHVRGPSAWQKPTDETSLQSRLRAARIHHAAQCSRPIGLSEGALRVLPRPCCPLPCRNPPASRSGVASLRAHAPPRPPTTSEDVQARAATASQSGVGPPLGRGRAGSSPAWRRSSACRGRSAAGSRRCGDRVRRLPGQQQRRHAEAVRRRLDHRGGRADRGAEPPRMGGGRRTGCLLVLPLEVDGPAESRRCSRDIESATMETDCRRRGQVVGGQRGPGAPGQRRRRGPWTLERIHRNNSAARRVGRR